MIGTEHPHSTISPKEKKEEIKIREKIILNVFIT